MKPKTFTADFFREAGKKGGTTTSKKGKEFFQKIGKLGGTKRWANKKTSDEAVSQKAGMD